ncbi:hypothetical protein cypCar_00003307, partial [Cyprinus carpio]
HDTVPSTTERNEKQIKLTHSCTKVKQTIQAKEKELQKMKMDITSHSDSAKKAVENSKKVFSELVKLIEKKSNEVIEEIKAQEKADLDHGTKLQKKLEGEITELKKREGVLDDLLQTEDNIQFLQNYETVSSSSGSDELPSFSFQPYCSFEDVRKLICDLTGRLETTCSQEISKTINKVSDLSTKRPPFDFVVGDRVRVKPSVVTPIHKWGSVTLLSVGVVKKIQGEWLTVDFPEQRNWTGVVSEMEHVTGAGSGPSSLDSNIKIGDKVRVKPSVVTPTHKWGAVIHKSIGVVQKIQGDSLTVDFPEQKNWTGIVSEMETVASAGSEIQDESLIVDFPEHKKWTGLVSEMELVTSADLVDIKVGDRVRVKSSIITPKHNWGGHVTHKSVGVVRGKIYFSQRTDLETSTTSDSAKKAVENNFFSLDVQGETVTVDFPEQEGWIGGVSEMELVVSVDL